MHSGDLDERVSIVKGIEVGDGQGGRTVTWVDCFTGTVALTRLAASVMPVRSLGERLQAAAINATVTYQVTIRYRPDVTTKMRVQWRKYRAVSTTLLDIFGVSAEDGGRAFLVLDCTEVQA